MTDPTNLSHIAEAAGVSVSTVSRVVNGFGWVKVETARRVEEAMRELNFDPSSVRRGPRKGSKHKAPPMKAPQYIAVVLLGEGRRLLEHPVFAEVLAGVTDGARRRGAMVVVEELPDRASLDQFARRQGVAGAVAIAHQNAQEWLDPMRRHMPVVWVMGEGARSWSVDHVAPDNLAIGAMAYEYLARECGCEHVAFWTTLPQRTIMGVRYVGFAQAALAAGRPKPAAFVMTSDPLLTESYGVRATAAPTAEELVAALLNAPAPRPSGLFVPADIQVPQLHAALRMHGVRTDTFRVISVDHEERLLSAMDPRPATIDTQPRALGALAAERLFHRILNPDAAPAATLLTPFLVRPQDATAAAMEVRKQQVGSPAGV
jgi:DNA-binding LacI/PurR family transcriptional regulator